MNKKTFEYIVLKKHNGITVEEFFKLYHFGKEKINSLIFNNNVSINNVKINNKTNVLKENDIIKIYYEIPTVSKYKCEIKVIYEDEYILVVNKPNKMLIHTDGISVETLTNAVHYYLSKNEKIIFAFPIHRIDYNTTGIVIFAKDPLTLSFLSFEVEQHTILKEYVCLCYNKFNKLRGKIDKKIAKDRHSSKQLVCSNGKEAISYYEVLKNGKIAKVKVSIIHGRTHQIRVHMQSINHPILGDELYGIKDNYNLKLHFKKIIFQHPFKEEKMCIECEEDFECEF